MEQTHLRDLHKKQEVAGETLKVEAWYTSDRVKIGISTRHDALTPQKNTLELHNAQTPYKEVGPNQ